jgi:hypothetical protein
MRSRARMQSASDTSACPAALTVCLSKSRGELGECSGMLLPAKHQTLHNAVESVVASADSNVL